MSPSSKSKSKNKSARAAKEQKKASSKPTSAPINAGSSIPASAYNPVLGTFHTIETAVTASSAPSHSNGRFRTIDEMDGHSTSSHGTGPEYDSVSNNESCSGESDELKEKMAGTAPRTEAIPGSNNDKREKIRQKNERKHQRQREKRAQELHERCSGFLMSRKLEVLAQTLVAMGFSYERATMALILNEGRVEESVAWLFEGGDDAEQKEAKLDRDHLKIDIAEELARVSEMEIKYKCTKQEVERVVVACEGDLEKTDETLRVQKREPAAPPKPEGTGDPPVGKPPASVAQVPVKTQLKTVASVNIQQRRDGRDSYTKVAVPAVEVPSESGIQNLHYVRKTQPKIEWARPQAVALSEKSWPSVSSTASVSHSLASPLQTPAQSKTQARYTVVASEVKNPQTGAPREPVIMMQRPQSMNAKQNPTISSLSASPPVTTGWYRDGVTNVELPNVEFGDKEIVNVSTSNPSSQQCYNQERYQPFSTISEDSATAGWVGSSSNATGTTSLATPSSLGLFTGWGSTGSSGQSSPVDWSTALSMQNFDYSRIDWSMELTSLRRNDLWVGLESYANGQTYDGWSWGTTLGTKATRPVVSSIYMPSLQEVSRVVADASTVGSPEWTSPFAGKDIFSLPRQSVTSPSP